MSMYPPTHGERVVSCQTLVCYLQGLTGQNVIVELKNEFAVEGTLTSCDCFMNLYLQNATVYKRRIKGYKPTKIEHVGICPKHIRFVHTTKQVDIIPLIRRSIRILVGQKKAKNNF